MLIFFFRGQLHFFGGHLRFLGGHLHICERVFSALTDTKTKYRSRLNVETDLWVYLTQIVPKIDEFRKVKQAHPSH